MFRLIRRIVPIAVIVALLSAICPAPARALSTQSEIQIGQETDKQITSSSVIETDPLLNAWVQGISAKLWKQVARKDVPYNIKIIKSNDVNAFSTMGGYVYMYEGLLDFAQSDDELSGVIGHETGHIERRHSVTMQAKAQGLNLLFGILSLFSPLVYRFGNIAQAGIMAKMSRVDELQADQYGLLLMSRAGYDPQANVSFMKHLATLADAHSDLVTKYLQDHPDPKARIGHMVGYDELDPTKVTAQQRLVRALHDLDEARYNVAMMQFTELVKEDPSNQQALLGLGQAQLALGETSKSEQTLGEALQRGGPAVKAAAQERITALRAMESHTVSFAKPNLAALRAKVDQAQQTQAQAVASVGARHDQGRDQIKSIQSRLDSISYEIPDFSRVDIKRGSRLESVVKDLTGMARSVNSALEDSSTAVNGVGSLNTKTNKVDGLLRENEDILAEMKAPLRDSPIASQSVAIFPSYPRMYAELGQADGDMVRAVDAGRAAAMQLDQSLGDLDAFIKRLGQVQLNYFGDISQIDYASVLPLIEKANQSLGGAAVSASQAAQLYNMARANQLEARITMLGVGTSPQRYATLQKALDVRFGDGGPDYGTMLRRDLSPGEIAAATIVAADTKTSTAAIVREAAESHRSVVDVANARGMHAEALEIFLGLTYLAYTDDPFKEAHPSGSGQTTSGL